MYVGMVKGLCPTLTSVCASYLGVVKVGHTVRCRCFNGYVVWPRVGCGSDCVHGAVRPKQYVRHCARFPLMMKCVHRQ